MISVITEQFHSWLPQLLGGLRISLIVTGMSLLIGIPLGFFLSLGVMSKVKATRWAALTLVEVGRGAPSLVLLQFAYFGLPTAGLTLTSWSASILALSWTTGAYTSEIIRAGLQSIPAGQREAAEAIGLTKLDMMRFIVVPQGLRIAIPALLGFAILIFQTTSLCFAIALPELTARAYEIGTNSFQYLPALVLAGLLYLLICIPATMIVGFIEARAHH